MSKFCSNCGNALEAGSKFCNHCGTPVDMDASVSGANASGTAPGAMGNHQNVGAGSANGNVNSNASAAPGNQGVNANAQKTLDDIQQSGEKLMQDGQKLAQESAQALNQYIQNMKFYSPTMNDESVVDHFFSFKGRLNRMRYFKRLLLIEVIYLVLEVVVRELFGDPFFGYLDAGGKIVFFLITMVYGAS
ncbi:zinc-ribbon domain-containing protein [uncultured Veillonella sp.]|uniref:zinc-ribbon domain-containing protein n=1 Tax=uncultured Veillonella sp. TaxID=159268 RepID=UPI00261F604A|nr:zinc-ribbon domain-containing protein [uncultured Veillonella sp.]